MKINPILKKFESSLINSHTLINDQKKKSKKTRTWIKITSSLIGLIASVYFFLSKFCSNWVHKSQKNN